MANKFLDDTGLSYLWDKIKNKIISVVFPNLAVVDGAIASRNYTPRNYFTRNGVLYKTGSNIATGENLTGRVVNVGDELSYFGAIIYDNTSSDRNIASNSTLNLLSLTLPEGVWLINGTAHFSNNSNGFRSVGISLNDTNLNDGRQAITTAQAASNDWTRLQVHRVYNVGRNSTLKIYLNARQNSGSTISVSGGIMATRIAQPTS